MNTGSRRSSNGGMRTAKLFLGVSAVAAGVAFAGAARAETEFDVNVAGDQITVTTHAPWHINKQYPWKVVAGGTKLDKGRFSLAETSASIASVPKGHVTLKGAVCSSGEQSACKTFVKELEVR